MPKSIGTALKAHIGQAVTTLASCWQIVRLDGATFSYTTLDEDLVIEGTTYLSTAGFTRSAIITHTTQEVDNVNIIGFFSTGGITAQDVQNGKFDYATVYYFLVNWTNLSQGILRLRRGILGECVRTPAGVFEAELRGLTQLLVQEFGNFYSPICRVDLGDSLCKFPIASLYQTGTVAATINQLQFMSSPLTYLGASLGNTAIIHIAFDVSAGTVLEIQDGAGGSVTVVALGDQTSSAFFGNMISSIAAAISAGTLHMTMTITGGQQITLVNNTTQQGLVQKSGDLGNGIVILQNFTENYLDGGVVTWLTGSNTGVSMELKTYTPAGQIVNLWLPMSFPIVVGDQFQYYPGCDKRRETCALKFSNILNFRGEPDMPGNDKLYNYPDATG